jgi:hypothetical protein
MKGGCLHRLLVSKLCLALVALLTVLIIVLLLEEAPVLTVFSTRSEQLKVLSHGSLKSACSFFYLAASFTSLNLLSALFVDLFVFPLALGIPGSASSIHTHKSRGKVNKGNCLCNVLPSACRLSFSPLMASCFLAYLKLW